MKFRRTILHPKLGRRREPPIIPYNPLHKARCPFCRSMDTMYVPAIATGHCNACRKSWRFLADPEGTSFERPTIRPRRIDYRDLLGFCIAMRRNKASYREARERYAKLGIVIPEDETFERAWKEARDFA